MLCSLSLALPSACLRDPVDATLGSGGLQDPQDSTDEGATITASSAGPTTTTSTDTSTTGEPPAPLEKLDLLFVIDNSGGTALEQRRLAEAMRFVGEFLEFEVLDWRIAVTTTDNGNPWCGGTTPEAGAFVNSSCRNRIGNFVDQTGSVDASEHACLDLCPWSDIDIDIQGAWLEKSDGMSNYNPSLWASDVLPCLIPQGINGCGFEAPLESLYKAELRTRTESDPAFGFFRPDAAKGVLILTDEVDCSYNTQWTDIFLDAGGKVFWSDPDLGYPTSAVCWNAGVYCEPIGFGEFDCWPQNKGLFGEFLDEGDNEFAVLHPVDRYEGSLQALEDQVQALYPSAELGLAVIGGYNFDGEPFYTLPEDQEEQEAYGVGAGCSYYGPGLTPCVTDAQCGVVGLDACEEGYCLERETAISPVRMHELYGRMNQGHSLSYSSCQEDYSGAVLDFVINLLNG